MKEKEGNVFYDLRYDYGLEHGSLTIDALAKEFGIDKSSISKLENGKRKSGVPDYYLLKKYSEKFHVTYEYLYGETNAKSKENIDIGRELGLSDNAIETLKKLKKDPDVMFFVNEYLGQGEKTICFFQKLFQQLFQDFYQDQKMSEMEEPAPSACEELKKEHEELKKEYEIYKDHLSHSYNRIIKSYCDIVTEKLEAKFKRERMYVESENYEDVPDDVFEEIIENT